MKWISKPPLGTPLNWAHPLNKGLAGFWLLNEGMGNKAYDISGNGNHGILTNMAFPPTAASGWNPGRKGRGLAFDGVNDYVDAGNNPSIPKVGVISTALWVKAGDVSGSKSLIGNDNSGTRGWVFRIQNGNLQLEVNGDIKATGSATISTNVWIFVVLVADNVAGANQDYKLYYNVALDTSTTSGKIPESTANLNIGRRPYDGANNPFNGTIDEVRILNRALSASEIQELYINPYGMFL